MTLCPLLTVTLGVDSVLPMGTSESTGNSGKPARTRKPWLAWLTVAATIAITAISAAVVAYRYLITPETNCMISVVGDESMDGNTIEVIPRVAADPDRAALRETLREKNQYSARFFLSSGTFQVIMRRPDGSRVVDITDFIPPGRHWKFDASGQRVGARRPATTQSAATH